MSVEINVLDLVLENPAGDLMNLSPSLRLKFVEEILKCVGQGPCPSLGTVRNRVGSSLLGRFLWREMNETARWKGGITPGGTFVRLIYDTLGLLLEKCWLKKFKLQTETRYGLEPMGKILLSELKAARDFTVTRLIVEKGVL